MLGKYTVFLSKDIFHYISAFVYVFCLQRGLNDFCVKKM